MRRFSFRESRSDYMDCPTCDIPGYGLDHNYADAVWQGEDPATHDKNIPALTAASTGGGFPHPFVLDNGINTTDRRGPVTKISKINPKFRELYDGREEDALHMQESVCDVLSRVSYWLTESEGLTKARQTYDSMRDKVSGIAGRIGSGIGTFAGALGGAVSYPFITDAGQKFVTGFGQGMKSGDDWSREHIRHPFGRAIGMRDDELKKKKRK